MAKKEQKEKSIEETLWDSANKLHGSVEPAEYKHVVLGLIFLKFASDKFEERRKELIAELIEPYKGIIYDPACGSGGVMGESEMGEVEACTNQACCGMICESPEYSAFLYFHLLHNQEFISSQAIGGAQPNLSKNFIENFPLLKPTDNLLSNEILRKIIDCKAMLTLELINLGNVKELLLAKMAKE